jgi:3-hydroxyisobutyrate dehydrogenase
MKIGLIGCGPLAGFIGYQLAEKFNVVTFDVSDEGSFHVEKAEAAKSAAAVARESDLILVCVEFGDGISAMLFGEDGVAAAMKAGSIVVDFGQADPDKTRSLARELNKAEVTLVDAALHTENMQLIHESSAILCGGEKEAVESLQEVLKAVCPTVVYCGDVGSGQAARLVVATVAACNRLITYECAAMGAANGLTLADMSTVLNKSSGYNSASARVLPALVSGTRVAEVTLGAVSHDLALASTVAMRYGAPMFIGTLVRSLVDAASNRLGKASSLDDLATIWQADARLPSAAAREG